jgi:ElaB/YqjD/DUF883 family membrane-anchored ribosome-binding protein
VIKWTQAKAHLSSEARIRETAHFEQETGRLFKEATDMAEESPKDAGLHDSQRSRAETQQAWEEVGRQFEELGQSLAIAFQALWKREETQQHLDSVRQGLQALADEVSEAVTTTAASPEAQDVRARAQKTADSARKATEKAVEDARPQIVSALQQVNTELQRLIDHLEAGKDSD